MISVGFILLEGGAEFGGAMEIPDLKAIICAGGLDAPLRIIPAAAAPDNNHQRAGENGLRWFKSLGATDVLALPLIDRQSADTEFIVTQCRQARLIYLLGGFPHHLAFSLKGSRAWQAMHTAWRSGAVIAGSSAGAMVLCEFYYDPQTGALEKGLGLIRATCIIPHFNSFGQDWISKLSRMRPQMVLVGIDEATGMLNHGPDGAWHVYGQGRVTVYHRDRIEYFTPEQPFRLPKA